MGKLTALEHLQECAEMAKQYTAESVAEVARTAAEAIEEQDEIKADKGESKSVTLPTSGWGNESGNTSYPKYCDITVNGVTAKDRAEVTISPNSISEAVRCGICPTCETTGGKLRIRSVNVPANPISI